MDEFKPAIGLLDFQSRGGPIDSIFSSQKGGLKSLKEQQTVHSNQILGFESINESKHAQGRSSSKVKTCNLDELMSGCSLMYVSGDSQGLDSTKLQLEICTNSCCNSRVKYARVHRDKQAEQDSIWSSNRFTSLAPLNTAAARSSWDLGSDGASTPGSNSWGDAVGDNTGHCGHSKLNMWAIGGAASGGWPQQYGDFGLSSGSSNQVFLDQGDSTWSAVDAFFTETDKAFGHCPDDSASDYSDSWTQFQNRKFRNQKL